MNADRSYPRASACIRGCNRFVFVFFVSFVVAVIRTANVENARGARI
jgi:hypothetical protein